MKTVVVLRHVAFEDLGTLGDVLSTRGCNVHYLEAGWDDLSRVNAVDADLFIVLGGPIGVYDQADYPFLKDEMSILEQRLEADLPTLGICLGAQLMARVLGANIYPGQQGKEIGWSPIELSESGQKSCLTYLKNYSVLHWHGDTFDLPSGCTHLASSAKYQNQAFSYKQNCLALQFHPEVYPRGLERWFIGHASEINSSGIDMSALRFDTKAYGSTLALRAVDFWNEWLDQIESPSIGTSLQSQVYCS